MDRHAARPRRLAAARAGRSRRSPDGSPRAVRRPGAAGDGRRGQRPRHAPPRRRRPPTAARRLLGVVPIVLGEPDACAGGVDGRAPGALLAAASAAALGGVSSTGRSSCSPTTSWRRARSPSASPARRGRRPYQAFVAGLAVIQGPLHGAAAQLVHELLVECEQHGAAIGRHPAALARRRAASRLRPQDLQGRRPPAGPAARGGRAAARPARPRRRRSTTCCAEAGRPHDPPPQHRPRPRRARRSSPTYRPTCRSSPSPASPASPPTSSRSWPSARCATAASPGRAERGADDRGRGGLSLRNSTPGSNWLPRMRSRTSAQGTGRSRAEPVQNTNVDCSIAGRMPSVSAWCAGLHRDRGLSASEITVILQITAR